MELRKFLSYLEDCIENGYEESLLCVEDEDGEEYPINSTEENDNGDIILYADYDTDCCLQNLYEDLEDSPRNASVYVRFNEDDEECLYKIKGEYYIDDDDDVCFGIYSSRQRAERKPSIVEQAAQDYEKYEEEYKKEGEPGLETTLNKFAARLGVKTVYMVLWLYYALSVVPVTSKAMIFSALGYLISPIDIISDFIPLFGLTDDVAVITAAFVAITKALCDADKNNVSQKAKTKLRTIFPNYKDSDLD